MRKVAMIGVGKLGQDCAEVMAQHYDVVGYDIEPRSPAFPMKNTIEEAVKDRDLIFIAAPTPHDPMYGGETPTSHLPNKDFDYSIVSSILEEVNKHVNNKQLVVLISTVLPGTVRRILRPLITNARFIYNPYLIAMGTIKWDMVNPEMVIIGTDDGSTTGDAKELIDFYNVFMQNDPRYVVGTWDEAESIKIFYNTFISTKLALVNMIQDVAEINGNINVDIVTQALADSKYRIMGPAYMKAGLGDAGACHPRDNIALRWLAQNLNLGYDLFDSIMTAREKQAENMALKCLKNGKNVTIVGKAYKPKVHYTNGSASMLVGYYIEKNGGQVNYYDIHTGDTDLKPDWTDVYLIGYWEEYVEQINFPQHAVVIDPWRKITPSQHTGEIIHYGDSRPKKKFDRTVDHLNNHKEQLFTLYPGLKDFDDHLHIVYAGINNDFTFRLRPTEEIVEELQAAYFNNKKIFLFDGNAEDFLPEIVIKIHRVLKLLNKKINHSQIFYSFGADNAQGVYGKLCLRHNITEPINLLPVSFFEYVMRIKSDIFKFTGEYPIKVKEKKFLCFNKVPRAHRIYLLEHMLQRSLVHKSFYSFQGYDDKSYANLFQDCTNFQKFLPNTPLVLNITPERNNPVTLHESDLRYYEQSYFSVVTETTFFKTDYNNESIFFSEKVFKPIILQHPFILVARPGSLKKLKEYGYKTFSPFIDERYDEIEDDFERLEFIANEIERLCDYDHLQMLEWQKSIKSIVEYNKKIFFEKNSYAKSNNFIDKFNNALNQANLHYSEFYNVRVIEYQEKTEQKLTWDIVKKLQFNNNGSNFTISESECGIGPHAKNICESKLMSGYTIKYPVMLDGGGMQFINDLIKIIKLVSPNRVYNQAVEWCAGFGVLGFEILGNKIANNILFHEYFDEAIKYLKLNIMANNIENIANTHMSNTIASLPTSLKADLVIGNPPHVFNFDQFYDHMSKDPTCVPETFANSARLCMDKDGLTHKEFFENIRKFITDDADIFLIENNHYDEYIELANKNGLKYMETYWMKDHGGLMVHGTIMHFKAA